jgi:hypothetical protein
LTRCQTLLGENAKGQKRRPRAPHSKEANTKAETRRRRFPKLTRARVGGFGADYVRADFVGLRID